MILNQTIPYNPLSPKPLPGVSPLRIDDWLRVDETYQEQLAEKERLVSEQREKVLTLSPQAMPAAQELLELVLEDLRRKAGFQVGDDIVICPDGRRVVLTRTDPMLVLSKLTQEDFCILEKQEDEHVLTGASLCFPASWLLAEKFMQPLVGIHVPVASYDENIARRVQRLFDGVRVDQPLWRFNALWYADPALHQPRTAHARRDERFAHSAKYMRSELQTIRRLPKTNAVVFGIHTYVLTEDVLDCLSRLP